MSLKVRNLFIIILLAKLLFMAVFSSGFENDLFVPFVKYFLTYHSNPWEYFVHHSVLADEFPYPPFMLYILSAFLWPLTAFNLHGVIAQNVLYKLPVLAADLLITGILLRNFPDKAREVLAFYFASPIVFYASYLHSQLDLIPTAILFLSICFLKQSRWLISAICFGLALSTKFHVIAAFPLIAVYLFRNRMRKQMGLFALVAAGIYCFFVAPYILSDGFQRMVLTNSKQMGVFEALQIGDLKIYLPLFALFMTYGRFALYEKINTDLLDAFLALVFSIFVVLIYPSPAWYTWMVPFLSVFLIKNYEKARVVLLPYLALNLFYLLYFCLCHSSTHQDLILWQTTLQTGVLTERYRNFIFTLLEVGLCANIWMCYKMAVLSNSIYRRSRAMVIGIGGDSGAGKTTLLSDIKLLLGARIVEIEGDGDHKWERGDEHWQEVTHLDPKANDLHRQIDTIINLKMGKQVMRSEYDHKTGQFTEPKLFHPNDFVVLLGLHPFYLPKMRKLIDLKIYLDPQDEVKTHWKFMRDTIERGHSAESVSKQIEGRQSDAEKYIKTQKAFADLVITYSVPPTAEPVESSFVKTGAFKLKTTLDSSIRLERLIELLHESEHQYEWDYAEDLTTQSLTIYHVPSAVTIQSWARELILNLEEILVSPSWLDGYRGFVQLIVMLAISDKLRESHSSDALSRDGVI